METFEMKHSCKLKAPVLVGDLVYSLSMQSLGRTTVSLPFFSLIICFVTAYIFSFETVNTTMCNVYNYIPSISAVTGIAPQCYIWRTCIGLHATPRFAIGFMYYNWYLSKIHFVDVKYQALFRRLLSVNFWLYSTEIISLVGIAVISNKENYYFHEKFFILFMFTSLSYELLTIILFRWTHPLPLDEQDGYSYKMKKRFFVMILSLTMILIYYFIKHRLYCQPGAFTIFSGAEYLIAFINIGFHYTAAIDFRNIYWYIGIPATKASHEQGTFISRPHDNHGKQM